MKIELEESDIQKLSEEITKRVLESLKPPAPVDEVLTVETLAAHLGTTTKWIYGHVHELPHLKVDGLLRFRRSAIDRLFEKRGS